MRTARCSRHSHVLQRATSIACHTCGRRERPIRSVVTYKPGAQPYAHLGLAREVHRIRNYFRRRAESSGNEQFWAVARRLVPPPDRIILCRNLARTCAQAYGKCARPDMRGQSGTDRGSPRCVLNADDDKAPALSDESGGVVR